MNSRAGISGNSEEITSAVSSDAERSRVISGIYDAVLDARRYDDLMDAWRAYLDTQLPQVADGKLSDGPAVRTVRDAELEEHFNRAFWMLERFGRGEEAVTDKESIGDTCVRLAQDGRGIAVGLEFANHLTPGGLVPELLGPMLVDDGDRLTRALADLGQARDGQLLAVLQLAKCEGRPQQLAAIARMPRGTTVMELELRLLDLSWSDTLDDTLSDAYGLTRSELDVARDFAAGRDTREIAEYRDRSIHTVRTQLKSLMQKMNIVSQSDLMRFVAMLSQNTDTDAPTAPDRSYFLGSIEMVSLPDGRVMEVQTLGPPDGQPMIFIHGMLDGTAVTPRIRGHLHSHGIQMICPVRPAFGTSSPHPDTPAALDTFANDLRFLMEEWEVGPAVLAGHMAGSPYAYAAAAADPDLYRGVISISGGVPLRSARQISAMAPRQRLVAWTARFAPALLPPLLRAGIAQIDSKDVDLFMEALYRKGSHDAQVVDRLKLASLIHQGYRFVVQQGERGFVVDSFHVTRDWSEKVEACSLPSVHVHGAHDPVVKIETVREFASRHPSARLDEYPDAGQLIFYEHPERVLQVALEMHKAAGPDETEPDLEAV